MSVLVFFLAFPFLGMTQESKSDGDKPDPISLERTESWTELQEKEGVVIEYKYAECRNDQEGVHKENVLLRFSNENDKAVNLEWDHLIWYDGNCRTCEVGNGEYRFDLELAAGGTKEGDCEMGTHQKFQVFARYLESGNGLPETELTGIRLGDLQVD